MIRGIIWGSTFQIAVQELEQIIENYKHEGIDLMEKLEYDDIMYIKFSNGDFWRAIKVQKEVVINYRCNISYIDKQIPQNLVDLIIKPITTCPPYHAISYY
jgi:hypothetical protein